MSSGNLPSSVPCVRVTDALGLCQIFTWVQGISTQILMLVKQHFTMEPFPQPYTLSLVWGLVSPCLHTCEQQSKALVLSPLCLVQVSTNGQTFSATGGTGPASISNPGGTGLASISNPGGLCAFYLLKLVLCMLHQSYQQLSCCLLGTGTGQAFQAVQRSNYELSEFL